MADLPLLASSMDIQQRIVGAADQLFAENGATTYPTLEQVRRLARANMNDVSAVMRAWRRAHLAPPSPHLPELPPGIQQSGLRLLAAIWQEASTMAGDALQAAQEAWHTERLEMDRLRGELASAYDELTLSLLRAEEKLSGAEQTIEAQRACAAHNREERTVMQDALRDAQAEVRRAGLLLDEKTARADDLRQELQAAHVRYERLQREQQQAGHLAGKAQRSNAQKLAALRAEITGLRAQLKVPVEEGGEHSARRPNQANATTPPAEPTQSNYLKGGRRE